MNRVIRNFSVLNKLRQKEKRYQSDTYPRSPTHIFMDQPTPVTTLQQQRQNLSPYQLYLIDNKAMERPFTGRLWDQIATGFYHCVVCDTRLFTFNHKYKANNGYASFWRPIENRVKVTEGEVIFDEVNEMRAKFKSFRDSSYKRCECANCSTHLGAVFFDGPPPSLLRYSINSELLKFKDMEEFPDPNIERKAKLQMRPAKVQYIR